MAAHGSSPAFQELNKLRNVLLQFDSNRPSAQNHHLYSAALSHLRNAEQILSSNATEFVIPATTNRW
jgi:hypothetical protein